MLFSLLLILGLNTKAPKKIHHHISVLGGHNTDNNADQPQ